MRILVIGGTGFLGRHISQEALRREHALTLLTRGRTNPELFPSAEHLRGDRTAGGLEALAGRTFHALIDTCGYLPTQVTAAVEALRDSIAHYTFISSLAVYPDPVLPGTDESTPVATVDGPVPDQSDDAYGALKALCEEAAERAMPGRVLSVRPGLLVGPFDETDRFGYWPQRVAEGGRVLAAEPAQPIQLIDVRDLASWLLDSVESGRTGAYNATGSAGSLTMEELIEACRDATGSDADVVWAGDRFLLDRGIEPWEELPLWLPSRLAGFFQVDCSKAMSEGLRFRPLAETTEQVFEWVRSRPAASQRNRLSRERERELLADWLRLPGRAARDR
jgi:2'-hydroxyisoflavone reductase